MENTLEAIGTPVANADEADIRVVGVTTEGVEIATDREISPDFYLKEFETLAGPNRYLTTDRLMEKMNERRDLMGLTSLTVATDF